MESWRRAAPRGAASHLWTKCPEVGQTKCACATQSHASARNNKFIYVLPNFTFTAGLILLDGWAFFDRLGGEKREKDVSVKAEDGLKRQRRYEILILEKS